MSDATAPTAVQQRSDALERVSDGVVSLDHDLRYTYVNTPAADLLGTEAESLLGERIWDAFPETEGTKAQDAIERAIETGQRASFERYNEALGKWWKVRVHPDETGLTIVFSDITAQQERLYELELTDTLFQNAQDGLFVIDVEDGGETFRINRVNPTYEAYTDLSASELRGKTVRELIDEVDSDLVCEKYRTCVSERRSLDYEEYLSTFDGGSWWETRIAPVVVDDEVTQIVGSTRNITDRKAQEKELRQKTRALDNAPVGISITDPSQEDNPMTYVNEAFTEITGYEKTESVGRNCRFLQGDGTDPEQIGTVRTAVDQVESAEVTLRNYRKDGTEFWNQLSIAPVKDDDGTLESFVGFQKDITRRRENENEIQTHLTQAQEIGHVGSWFLDIGTSELEWSDECYRIFGLEPETSITYEQFLERVHPEDRQKVDKAWNEALESGGYDIEHRIVVDGETRWVQETAEVEFGCDGEPERGIGVVRDITEQVQQTREIRAQKQRYESLFNSIGGAVAVTDLDGQITTCNPGFADLFGYEADKIEGDHLRTITDNSEDVALLLDNTDESTNSQIISYQKNSGQVFPGKSRSSPLRTHDDSIRGQVIHIIDISDEEENREQLQVLGRIFRHNVKNDMNVIIGEAQLIQERGSHAMKARAETILEKSRNFVEMAENQSRITELLTESPAAKEFELVPMIEETVADLQSHCPGATLTTEFPSGSQARTSREITEAIRELVENALVHSDQEHPHVEVTLRDGDEMIEVTVRDDGPGIPEQEWKVLTEEGKIHPLNHGTGLGLWFVTQAVRRSNGTVSFERNEMGGTTVTVRLPTG